MASPSLTEAERATLIRRVSNGAKRSDVAREFGVTRQAVSSLCNARAVSCLTKDIAEQLEVEATKHSLHAVEAKAEYILDQTMRLMERPEHYSAGAVRILSQNLMDAAKLCGQIVDRKELTGRDGEAIQIEAVTRTIVKAGQ